MFFASCKKPLPQLPANKGIETDTTSGALLKINNALIEREDSTIRVFAKSKGFFQKNELGFWFRIYRTGRDKVIQDSVKCTFEFKLENLSGKLIQSGINQIVVGRKQIIIGLEEGIKLMHKGDSAIFIIPTYLRYRVKGSESLIEPNTSVLCHLKVKY
jgi:FKBP-type peptidyl-prolyl cis-trans isomerase